MPIYESKGTLTDVIAPESVVAAQEYLQSGYAGEPLHMEQHLDEPLRRLVDSLDWYLDNDGHNYAVRAVTTRELTEDELKELASEVSGQNSDGLGEGFEQQEFAWVQDEDGEECVECNGAGTVLVSDDGYTLVESCDSCSGAGYFETESGRMISFDWETNDSPFVRIQ